MPYFFFFTYQMKYVYTINKKKVKTQQKNKTNDDQV